MSRFKGRNKRWNKSTRKARWRSGKRLLLAQGWIEVAENTLVPPTAASDYPPYIPTHLGGKIEKGSNVKLTKQAGGWPRRSEVNKMRQWARKQKVTLRQIMRGNGW